MLSTTTAALVVVAAAAAAQDNERPPAAGTVAARGRPGDPWAPLSGVELTLGAGMMAVDPAVARADRYSRPSLDFTTALGLRLFRIGMVSFDLGLPKMEDQDSFINIVQDCGLGGCSRPHGAESGVYGIHLSASAGLSTPPVLLSHLALMAGANLGWFSMSPNREIDKCSDCDEESLTTLTLLIPIPWRRGLA